MVTLCDRCLEKGKQILAYQNVGGIPHCIEEDLCEEHYKEWKNENKI